MPLRCPAPPTAAWLGPATFLRWRPRRTSSKPSPHTPRHTTHVIAAEHVLRRYSRDVSHADLRRENCAVAWTALGHAERRVCVIAHQALGGARRSPVSRRSEEP